MYYTQNSALIVISYTYDRSLGRRSGRSEERQLPGLPTAGGRWKVNGGRGGFGRWRSHDHLSDLWEPESLAGLSEEDEDNAIPWTIGRVELEGTNFDLCGERESCQARQSALPIELKKHYYIIILYKVHSKVYNIIVYINFVFETSQSICYPKAAIFDSQSCT